MLLWRPDLLATQDKISTYLKKHRFDHIQIHIEIDSKYFLRKYEKIGKYNVKGPSGSAHVFEAVQ